MIYEVEIPPRLNVQTWIGRQAACRKVPWKIRKNKQCSYVDERYRNGRRVARIEVTANG